MQLDSIYMPVAFLIVGAGAWLHGWMTGMLEEAKAHLRTHEKQADFIESLVDRAYREDTRNDT